MNVLPNSTCSDFFVRTQWILAKVEEVDLNLLENLLLKVSVFSNRKVADINGLFGTKNELRSSNYKFTAL